MSRIVSDFSTWMPYLLGEKFSDNYVVSYRNEGKIRYRNDVLIDICRNKKVLHIGCCDHVPLIKHKIDDNNWLHGQLTQSSQKVVGVDIDENAVRESIRISGQDNIYAGDITSTERINKITEDRYDYAVFGEVVEHISNPVYFLNRFRELYADNFDKIIITVPNAFRAGNIKGVLKNRETINSDHRYFFTPYTIAKVAVDAGFYPETAIMATFSKANKRKSAVLNKFPLLAEDLILIASQR